MGLTPSEIHFVGKEITDQRLVELYQRAALVVMPSLAEGLGLPILEAWTCGAPAIASCTTSLGEVVDDPRWVFDPLDPSSQASLIEQILTSAAAREQCTLHGQRRNEFFTWDLSADRALSAMTDLMRENPPTAIAANTNPPTKPLAKVTVIGSRGDHLAQDNGPMSVPAVLAA
ncbi:MAG: glycosyltransferase, partial [Actinomycetes bacterium]